MKISPFVALLAAGALAGCATPQPPLRAMNISLGQSVSLETQDLRSAPELADITGVGVRARTNAAFASGAVLWMGARDVSGKSSSARQFVPLAEVAKVEPLKANSRWSMTLLNGETRTINRTEFFACPPGASPEDDACPSVLSFQAQKWDTGGSSSTTVGTVKNLPSASFFVDSNRRINKVYASSEVAAAKAAIEKKFEAGQRGKAAANERAHQQREAEDKVRVAKIKNASKGTTVNCTSYSLLDRSRPVDAGEAFRCAGLGMTTMSELRAAGWEARVTGRIPTEGMLGVADSIEMEAIKRR